MSDTDDLVAARNDLQSALSRIDRLIQASAPARDRRLPDLLDLPRTKAIEAVLDDYGGAMRPIEIWKALREAGRSDPKMEVQVTTFDLYQRGRIGKLGRGLYITKKG